MHATSHITSINHSKSGYSVCPPDHRNLDFYFFREGNPTWGKGGKSQLSNTTNYSNNIWPNLADMA